jgi:hypothetical protein
MRGLRGARCVSRLSAVLIVCATLSATTGLAHAGACADQIAQLRQATRRSAADPAARPTAPQSIGAQLHHQPTPESVGKGETYAQLTFAADLAQAEAQDALGNEAECMLAVGRAKQRLDLD